VDANSSALHYGVATPHPRRADDVPIGFRYWSHVPMLWFEAIRRRIDVMLKSTSIPNRGAIEFSLL